jgi:hypothetical protein
MIDLSRAPRPPYLTEIAGNETILLTGIAPSSWESRDPRALVEYAVPLATDVTLKRVAIRVRVPDLLPVLRAMHGTAGLTVDHIYDY